MTQPESPQERTPSPTLLLRDFFLFASTTKGKKKGKAKRMQVDGGDVVCPPLGGGTYGRVYRCGGRAIKVYRDQGPSRQEKGVLPDVIREIGILKQIRHPNIVAFAGASRVKPGSAVPSLITEYVSGGDLGSFYAHWGQDGPTPEAFFSVIFGLFSAVNYLHTLGIIHRDIKIQNILWCPRTGQCKLADFGSAAVHRPESALAGDLNSEWLTTLPYRAPEALLCMRQFVSQKVDVWSAGVVVYEIITGRSFIRHDHETEEDALLHIFSLLGTPTPTNTVMPSYFVSTDPFLGTIPQPDVVSRPDPLGPSPTFDSLRYYMGAASPAEVWGLGLDAAKRLLRGCICIEPSARMTADEAFHHIARYAAVSANLKPETVAYHNALASSATEDLLGIAGLSAAPAAHSPSAATTLPSEEKERLEQVAAVRKELGMWAWQASVRNRNRFTRRNFHVMAAIVDEICERASMGADAGIWHDMLLLRGEKKNKKYTVGAFMVVCCRLARKICDSDIADMDLDELYEQTRQHCIGQVSQSWLGHGDSPRELAGQDLDALEIEILDAIGWTSFRILPIDIEEEHICPSGSGGTAHAGDNDVLDPEVYRYFIDRGVALGVDTHVGANVRRLVDVAWRLERALYTTVVAPEREMCKAEARMSGRIELAARIDGRFHKSPLYVWYNSPEHNHASGRVGKALN